jgi:hypothetical protein
VCVKDEWKCLLLLYIIISLFCLSKCKTNVVTKLIFENSCHTLCRWWCKEIYKILTIGGGKKKKIYLFVFNVFHFCSCHCGHYRMVVEFMFNILQLYNLYLSPFMLWVWSWPVSRWTWYNLIYTEVFHQ